MDLAAERFWIIRPADRLRRTLAVAPHDRPRTGGEVALRRLESDGGVIEIADLLLEIGQPVTLGLANGESLKGAVRWVSDTRAGIRWEAPLGTAAVRAFRVRHMGFLKDAPALDPTVRRSVA